jgi:geranylgeranyl pyrophosphate synthase
MLEAYTATMQLAHTYGAWIFLVIAAPLLLWLGWAREKKLSKRIDSLEKQLHSKTEALLTLVRESSAVIARNSVALEHNTAVLESLNKILLENDLV